MKLKHKEFILGVVIGGVIFGSLTSFATAVLNVTENPFRVKVDGAIKNIEGYNINSSTYFKLRDIGEHVGFDVDFKDDSIMIKTGKKRAPAGALQTSYNYANIDGIEYPLR